MSPRPGGTGASGSPRGQGPRALLRSRAPRDPWRSAPTSELQDQVLPRWFVLLAVAMVPVALGVLVAAFVVFGPEEVPVEARRPPPASGLSSAVGDFVVGSSQAVPIDGEACPLLAGIGVAGEAADRQRLTTGLSALCDADLSGSMQARLRRFAAAGGVVRFAQFQATGVDSTVVLDRALAQLDGAAATDAATTDATASESAPVVLVNARFSQTDPRWIAPLLVHDLTLLELGPGDAGAAVAARQAELATCEALFTTEDTSRACDDARAVLALPDPLAALRAQGFN